MFKCQCNKIFVSKESRGSHRRYCKAFQVIYQKHINDIENKRRHECPICNEKFNMLYVHVFNRLKDKRYKKFYLAQKKLAIKLIKIGKSVYCPEKYGFVFGSRRLIELWRENFAEKEIRSIRKLNTYIKKTFVCKECKNKYEKRQTIGLCDECIRKRRKPFNCKECNKPIKKSKSGFCQDCLRKNKLKDLSKIRNYRSACVFVFSLRKYANEFDFELIEKYGWYSAANRGNNKNGIVRDHLLSIDYGFKNKIHPNLISHPANCQLIRANDNLKKNIKSSITLMELEAKIKDWDKKYCKYRKFDVVL